jgi:hypothetical protein
LFRSLERFDATFDIVHAECCIVARDGERHASQAATARGAFNGPSNTDRNRVLLFLSSL